MKKFILLTVLSLFISTNVNAEKTCQKADVAYLENLKLEDINSKLEFLLLTNIYHQKDINSDKYAQISSEIHQYIVKNSQEIEATEAYKAFVKDNYLECYKNQKCLFEVLKSQLMTFDFLLPCSIAQQYNMVTRFYPAGGGHGAYTSNLSDCDCDNKYEIPKDVKNFYDNIYSYEYYNSFGSVRFVHRAKALNKYYLGLYHPNFLEQHSSTPPLAQWSLESYPNWKKTQEILSYGIGFEKAKSQMAEHYEKTFKADKKQAENYAGYFLTPFGMDSEPINTNSTRYKILSGKSLQDIEKTLHEKDEGYEDNLLMISINRPDALNLLIKECLGTECSIEAIEINSKNEIGKTALMYATQFNYLESVKLLLKNGANINLQTNDSDCLYEKEDEERYANEPCMKNGNRTALMYALQEGNYEVSIYLIKEGANTALKDSQGMTAYDYLIGKAPFGDPKNTTDIMGDEYPIRKSDNLSKPVFTKKQFGDLQKLLKK